MKRRLRINGTLTEFEASGDTPLLWILRDTLGLTGTKFACGVMACGACTVLVDGQPMRTCGMPVSAFNEAQDIVTIEGLDGPERDPVQKAWTALSVAQCGYCQSGMIMAAKALLARNPDPSDADIDGAMTNICRCGTYQQVRAAIRQAAEEMRHA
ncbi:MAG: (2Fe-2S)-binding protein [Gammaproteobacteria bacterium]